MTRPLLWPLRPASAPTMARLYAIVMPALAVVISISSSSYAGGYTQVLPLLVVAMIVIRWRMLLIALVLFLTYLLGDISGVGWPSDWGFANVLEGQIAVLGLMLVVVSLRFQAYAEGIFPMQISRVKGAWWPSRVSVTRQTEGLERFELPSMVIGPVVCFLVSGAVLALADGDARARSYGLNAAGFRALKLVLMVAAVVAVVHGVLSILQMWRATRAEQVQRLQQELWRDLRREACTAARIDQKLHRTVRRQNFWREERT